MSVGFLRRILRQLDNLNRDKLTRGPTGFKWEKPIVEISPQDKPLTWLVYHALNILISPDREISPVARYRSIELLTNYPIKDLEEAFFFEEESQEKTGQRRNPSFGFAQCFEKQLLRLPREFWQKSDRERAKHEKWENNPYMRRVLRVSKFDSRGKPERFDYGATFNTLVTSYPRQAIHVALLMLTSFRHRKAALNGLINFAKLDPISAQEVFGPDSSYFTLHLTPSEIEETIPESLGVAVYDRDFAAEFADLPPGQLLQVIRRLQLRLQDSELSAANLAYQQSKAYFETASKEELRKRDPKGYYQLLGINPDTDPKDFDTILKGAYRRLAMKYHPDAGSERDEKKMKEINLAYEILSDPEKREQYSR